MLGLIARADNRGLGQQTWAVARHLNPDRVLVVNCPSQQPLRYRADRFPDATVIDGLPTITDLERFCDGLSSIYTAETGYSHHLWEISRRFNVRTVLHANYEFLDRHDTPTVWAAPSTWHLDDFPAGAVHLPVPVETDRLTVESKPATAKRFLHVVGRPAIHDRNGTIDFLQSLQFVTTPIEVTVTCQVPGYVGKIMNDHMIRIPNRHTFRVETSDVAHYWDLYIGQHAMILPRRFGGLCLPAQEAVGAGLPVIMPNISPNDWLPDEWLVPAHKAGEFRAKQRIAYYRTDPTVLADRINRLASDPEFYRTATETALQLRDRLSWDILTPQYRNLLC